VPGEVGMRLQAQALRVVHRAEHYVPGPVRRRPYGRSVGNLLGHRPRGRTLRRALAHRNAALIPVRTRIHADLLRYFILKKS
jgi:hypothetical protein